MVTRKGDDLACPLGHVPGPWVPFTSPVCGIPCRGQETTPASHGILQVAVTAVGIFSDLTLCLISDVHLTDAVANILP